MLPPQSASLSHGAAEVVGAPGASSRSRRRRPRRQRRRQRRRTKQRRGERSAFVRCMSRPRQTLQIVAANSRGQGASFLKGLILPRQPWQGEAHGAPGSRVRLVARGRRLRRQHHARRHERRRRWRQRRRWRRGGWWRLGGGSGGSGGGSGDGGVYTIYAHSNTTLYTVDLATKSIVTVGDFNAPMVAARPTSSRIWRWRPTTRSTSSRRRCSTRPRPPTGT